MSKEAIDIQEYKLPPGLPLSKGIKKGNLVYVSGSLAFNEDGEFVGEGDIYAQTMQTLKVIGAIVEKAGGTVDDIVKVNVYLKTFADFEGMNRAYKDFFGETTMPARTTTGVKLAQDRFLIEIDAEAVLG
jgi:reactive intermediate/imine deaminase